MERLTGPILYVLIAWGIVTAVFMLLLIRRSLLASHEDDQIFLDAAQEHMAREQRELVAKIQTLSRPLMTSGIASGALLLVLAGLFSSPFCSALMRTGKAARFSSAPMGCLAEAAQFAACSRA